MAVDLMGRCCSKDGGQASGDGTGRQQLGFVVLFVLGFELGCCWVLGLVGFGVIWVFSGLLLGLGLG